MQTFTEDDFVWRYAEEMVNGDCIEFLFIQIPKGHVFYGKDCETINELIAKKSPNLLSYYNFFKVRSTRMWTEEWEISIDFDCYGDIDPILTMLVEVQQMVNKDTRKPFTADDFQTKIEEMEGHHRSKTKYYDVYVVIPKGHQFHRLSLSEIDDRFNFVDIWSCDYEGVLNDSQCKTDKWEIVFTSDIPYSPKTPMMLYEQIDRLIKLLVENQ